VIFSSWSIIVDIFSTIELQQRIAFCRNKQNFNSFTFRKMMEQIVETSPTSLDLLPPRQRPPFFSTKLFSMCNGNALAKQVEEEEEEDDDELTETDDETLQSSEPDRKDEEKEDHQGMLIIQLDL
jgi:hypothetical protein